MKRRVELLSASAFLSAGLFLGRETLAFIWTGLLNLLTAGAARSVTFQTFPWLNALGVALMLSGVALLAWPGFKKMFRRITLDEDRVVELISLQAPQHPPGVTEERVAEIIARIDPTAALNEKIELLDRRVTPAIGELRQSLDALGQELQPVRMAERRRKAAQLMKNIEALKMPKDGIDPHTGTPWSAHLGASDSVHAELMALGISDEELTAASAALRATIMGDSRYLTLDDGEDAYWKNGDAKRQWHLRNQRWDAALTLLREKGLG